MKNIFTPYATGFLCGGAAAFRAMMNLQLWAARGGVTDL